MDVKHYAACVGAPWGEYVVAKIDGLQMIRADESTHVNFYNDLAHMLCRYVFFLNWSWIVPPQVTDAYECVNFHCTDLRVNPMRGGHPIENLILCGRTETVITAHRMTEVIDGGPVYCVSDPVSLAGTKEEILGRFVEPVAGMIRKIVAEEPMPVPQKGEVVTFERLRQEKYDAVWREAPCR